MPKFTYTGQDSEGNTVTQTVEAKDRFAVYEIARSSGHTVRGVSEKSRFSLGQFLNVEAVNAALSRVSLDEMVLISRNLSAMLKAGLTLSRALSVIERQTKNPKLKKIILAVKERITKGDQFNEALREHPKVFSDLYVAMVRAGEEGGTLAEALETLGFQMERASNLRKKVKGAMIYPIIVITIMVIIGFLMMIYVMPSITGTFLKMNVTLPPTTQALIAVSNFINEYTALTIGAMIGSIIAFLLFLRTSIGKRVFHMVLIKSPVIGTITKETNAARTSRTLSSLLLSGVDVMRAISITEEVVQNVYFKSVLKEASVRVEKGKPLSEVFIERNDLYPVLVGEMIAVGEETGQISNMLSELATFYEREVEQKTENISTIIEPLMMVVIGGGVGFFALSVISPIYSISNNL